MILIMRQSSLICLCWAAYPQHYLNFHNIKACQKNTTSWKVILSGRAKDSVNNTVVRKVIEIDRSYGELMIT